MKTTGIFTPYTPTDEDLLNDAMQLKETTGVDIIFLRSPRGEDWYTAQKEFSDATLKIAFDENKIIRSYSYDASAIFPVNLAVSEVSDDSVPDGFGLSGLWVFDGKKIIAYQLSQEELVAEANATKSRLMSDAEAAIAPLKRAVKYNMATDQEKALLEQWEVYSVLLSRVDTSKAPDITWPEKPS